MTGTEVKQNWIGAMNNRKLVNSVTTDWLGNMY